MDNALDETRFCKDCIHAHFWSAIDGYGPYQDCDHPAAVKTEKRISLVIGAYTESTPRSERSCQLVRRNEAQCGTEGRWWQRKPPTLLEKFFG